MFHFPHTRRKPESGVSTSLRRRYTLSLYISINALTAGLLLAFFASADTTIRKDAEEKYALVLERTMEIQETRLRQALAQARSLLLDPDLQEFIRMTGRNSSMESSEFDYLVNSVRQKLTTTKINQEDIETLAMFKYDVEFVISDTGIYRQPTDNPYHGLYNHIRSNYVIMDHRYRIALHSEGGFRKLVLILPLHDIVSRGVLVFVLDDASYIDLFDGIDRYLHGESALLTPERELLARTAEWPQEYIPEQESRTLYRGKIDDHNRVIFHTRNRYGIELIHAIAPLRLYRESYRLALTLIMFELTVLLLTVPLVRSISNVFVEPFQRLRRFLKDHNLSDTDDISENEMTVLLDAYSRLEDTNESHKPLLEELALNKLIRNQATVPSGNLEHLTRIWRDRACICLLWEIDRYDRYRVSRGRDEMIRDKQNMNEILIDGFPESRVLHLIADKRFIHIINLPESADGIDEDRLEETKRAVEDYLGTSVTVALGSIAGEGVGPADSFSEAASAIEYKILTGPACVLRQDEVSTDTHSDEAMPLHDLREAIKAIDKSEADQSLARCLRNISVKPESIRESIGRGCARILEALEPYYDEDEFGVFGHREIRQMVEDAETLRDIHDRFQTILNRIFRSREKKRKERDGQYRERIDEIIGELYTNSYLQIADVAEHFDLSAAYFGRLFRDIMGTTFTHYVNAVRLERAERMLADNDKTIKVIAEATGFNSTQYFIRVFKEKYDMTPNEYRKLNQKSA